MATCAMTRSSCPSSSSECCSGGWESWRSTRWSVSWSSPEVTHVRHRRQRAPAALPLYYALRVLLALALPLAAVLLSGFLPFGIPSALMFIAAAWIAVVGLIAPAVYLDWRRSVMQVEYRHAFPDFMDLLVVCI